MKYTDEYGDNDAKVYSTKPNTYNLPEDEYLRLKGIEAKYKKIHDLFYEDNLPLTDLAWRVSKIVYDIK